LSEHLLQELKETFGLLLTLTIIIYGGLLVLGGLTGSPKLANRYARWLYYTVIGIIIWAILFLPRMLRKFLEGISKSLFGTRKKKGKKKKP